jgi:formylglycine-generating enzyme
MPEEIIVEKIRIDYICSLGSLSTYCMSKNVRKKTILIVAAGGFLIGAVAMLAIGGAATRTSTNDYCMSCHYHEQADADWKKSEHYNSESGVVTDCAACHLPPKENGFLRHYMVKARIGAKDLWKKMTRDKDEIDWSAKRNLEHATGIVYNESCEKCHVNLYPEGISDDGITAHLYYEDNSKKLSLQCISCHLNTGHDMPGYEHKRLEGKVMDAGDGEKYDSAAVVTAFENFVETVPGTSAAIRMVAVPGGEFTIGSPESEPFRSEDEGPQKRVKISPFFMGECEVTWSQFWAFYNETMSEGRTPPAKIYANNSRPDVDAVSGPTPPFGFPDQGWGMGERPAITMTHYAAETFCQWLSLKTGRSYRLPTEAEWEYAARGGTETPYFFEGNPKKYSAETFRNKLFGADTAVIARYAVYAGDSFGKTQEPSEVKANPFGLKNMLGNVMEYCSDRYSPDAYKKIADGALDPKGPENGDEYVVRGGSYSDDASMLRCAARSCTRNDEWLRTDPQNPKSIWWYSDIKGIGFRVVCDLPENLK